MNQNKEKTKAKPLLILFSFVALIYFWQGGLAATPARVPVVGSTLAARSLETTNVEVSGTLLDEEEIVVPQGTPVTNTQERAVVTDTILSPEPTEKETEGFLVEEQIDNFDRPSKSITRDVLVKNGIKKPLVVVGGGLNLPPSGSRIKLRAQEKVNEFVVDAGRAALQIIDTPSAVDTVSERRLLVLAFNFLDSPNPPFTADSLAERINGRIRDYYLEQSYGKLSLDADVYGVFTLPRNGINGTNCVSPSLSPPVGGGYSEVAQAIIDNNIDVSQYDHLVVIAYHPCQTTSSSSIGNSALFIGFDSYILPIAQISVASPDTFNASYHDHPFPWARFDYSVTHELGHGFGLRHSNGMDCHTNDFRVGGSGCLIEEYGNRFDVMGNTFYSTHFSAFLKEKLGWFSSDDYLTINQSGIYTLNPAEQSSSAKKAAKIKLLDSSEPFFLEYRQGIGFDGKLGVTGAWNSNIHGLFINQNVVNPNNPNNFSARLIDARPTSATWEDDVVESSLNGNQLFTVPEYGLQIGPILSANSSAISFRVRVESTECTRVDPGNQIIISPAFHAGATTHLTARMDNRDSVACGESILGLLASLPAGWTFVADAPAGIGLDPGAQEVSGLSITVPSGTPAGLYPVDIITQNYSSGLTATRHLTINLGSVVQASFLSPNTATASATVTVNGSGFSPNGLNFVSLTKGTLTAIVGSIQASSPTSLSFSVPSTGFDSSCGCQQPLTPGLYQLTVSTLAGTSNPIEFNLIN